jgi:FKBP-type peptidyl-prolyl cis-trans isomerase 2
MTQAKDGHIVKVHYTGKLDDGTVLDSSIDREPKLFTIGATQVNQSFEQAVVGMNPGESKTIKIPANKAYGPHRKEMTQVIARSQFPKHLKPEVGQNLQDRQANGQTIKVRVTDVSESSVTLDANHPLVGKDLTFDIQLVDVSKWKLMTYPEFEELSKQDPYYTKSRWQYLKEVIGIITKESFNSVLELGSYKQPIIHGSDIMDVNPGLLNVTYLHDATNIPWPIEDSKYDLFIALQVWEHLKDKQKEAFKEVIRTSKMAILSFPLNWNCPDNIRHHNITEEKISEWTLHINPVKKIKVGKRNSQRIIYFFKFE